MTKATNVELPDDIEAFVQEVEARFLSTPFVHKHPDIPRLVAIVREMGSELVVENAARVAAEDCIQRMLAERDALRERLAKLEAGITSLAERWGKESDEAHIEPEDAGDEEQYLTRSTISETLGDCHDSLRALLNDSAKDAER